MIRHVILCSSSMSLYINIRPSESTTQPMTCDTNWYCQARRASLQHHATRKSYWWFKLIKFAPLYLCKSVGCISHQCDIYWAWDAELWGLHLPNVMGVMVWGCYPGSSGWISSTMDMLHFPPLHQDNSFGFVLQIFVIRTIFVIVVIRLFLLSVFYLFRSGILSIFVIFCR